MTENFFYYLLAFNLAAGFLLVQVEIQRRAASAWMVEQGRDELRGLIQESIGLLWLIPGVIAILILTRWFHGRPVFTDRGEERNMTRHDPRNRA
jgi:hypothetical protein